MHEQLRQQAKSTVETTMMMLFEYREEVGSKHSCRGRSYAPIVALQEMLLGCSSGGQTIKSRSGECGAKAANPICGHNVGHALVECDGISVKYTASTLRYTLNPVERSRSRKTMMFPYTVLGSHSRKIVKGTCRKAVCSYLIKLRTLKLTRRWQVTLRARQMNAIAIKMMPPPGRTTCAKGSAPIKGRAQRMHKIRSRDCMAERSREGMVRSESTTKVQMPMNDMVTLPVNTIAKP